MSAPREGTTGKKILSTSPERAFSHSLGPTRKRRPLARRVRLLRRICRPDEMSGTADFDPNPSFDQAVSCKCHRLTFLASAALFERFDAGSLGNEAAEDLHALDRTARLHAQCDGGQVDDDAFYERLALPTIALEAAANLDFSDGLAHPLTCRIALPQETGFRRRLGRTYNPNVPPRLSRRSRRRRWAGAATRQTDREFRLGPGREIAWLPACNFVCKRNLVVRIGTQVRMSLEVSKRRCHLSSTRKTQQHQERA